MSAIHYAGLDIGDPPSWISTTCVVDNGSQGGYPRPTKLHIHDLLDDRLDNREPSKLDIHDRPLVRAKISLDDQHCCWKMEDGLCSCS
jgi:hypothetical protein